jgi:Co/Zn/Cd efflux system component
MTGEASSAGAHAHSGHLHPHGDHTGHAHDHHGHSHGADHDHPKGLRGAIKEIFAPHSHDAADSVDSALESSAAGIRAVKISLLILGLTAVAQIVIVIISGSIALAADTIHNFSDALTAVPLWIAFALSTKAATRRYTYGFGRVEDLAGLFVIAMITLSAIIAGYEAIERLIHPQPIENVGWVALDLGSSFRPAPCGRAPSFPLNSSWGTIDAAAGAVFWLRTAGRHRHMLTVRG